MLRVQKIALTQKNLLRGKTHRPTVFGCYGDLMGFVMPEKLQAYCFILPKTNLQQVYG